MIADGGSLLIRDEKALAEKLECWPGRAGVGIWTRGSDNRDAFMAVWSLSGEASVARESVGVFDVFESVPKRLRVS